MNTHHWALTTGQYLLQRRKQTYTAYSKQLIEQTSQSDNQITKLLSHYQDTLLQALCFLLGTELEAGHTVLHIAQDSHWQAILIDKVLADWFDLVEMEEQFANDDSFINRLADNEQSNQLQQILLHNNSLEKGHVQYLRQQLTLASNIYQFFQHFNQITANSEQSPIQILFTALCQLPLVVDQTNDIVQKPIVAHFNEKQAIITLWLHRSWQAEKSIIHHINRLNHAKPQPFDLANIDQKTLKDEQLNAIITTNQSAFSIITGGPGTGKTYTVAQLVIALHYANQAITENDKKINLILTAPTGKAAQRMQESLQSALDRAGVQMNLQEAKTIHRLLGIGQAGIPRYGEQSPLAEDVIIVDEASMLGVELASYLLASVKTGARLILLGDAHQLSAVEAGSVLADLCQIDSLKNVHAQLNQSSRFTDNSPIGQLAYLVNNPTKNSKQALQKLFTTYQDNLHLYPIYMGNNNHTIEVYQQLKTSYQAYFTFTEVLLNALDEQSYLADLLPTFNQFRILTAGHHGDYGDERINEVLSHYHRQYLSLPKSSSDWYHGRPVMVRKNNYNLGLFNGDIGICIKTDKGLAVYFEGKEEPLPLNMLVNLEVTTAYAMTVHKSQGSEFDHVAIMVSHADSKRLLSRELVYTAITRAKQQVSIYGSLTSIDYAIHQPTVRYTGLDVVR